MSLWVVVPGLVGILTQVVALVVTALSVARERELGTFDQLLVTPLRPWEILVGKIVPAMIIGLAEGTVIVVAALFWFRVPLVGSLVLLYASLFVFLLAIIGVGLFISALSGTQQQAILGAFLFLVPAIILSGFATPIDNMPDFIPDADARQSVAALPDDRAGDLPEGPAGRTRVRPHLADGRDGARPLAVLSGCFAMGYVE